MTSLDAVLAAMQRIQSAPITPGGWEAALSSAAAATRSDNTFLISGRRIERDASVIGFGTEPHNLSRFETVAREGRLPAWMNRMPVLMPQTSSGMSSDREFARSEFYNEVPRPIGGFYGVITLLKRSSQLENFFIAGRKLGREDYSDEDVSLVRILAQHLATALQVAERVAAADIAISGVFSALDLPNGAVILADRAGKVLFANRRADAALTTRDGLCCDGNGLAASTPRASAELRRRIVACADDTLSASGGGYVDVPRNEGLGSYRVHVASLRFQDAHRDIDPLARVCPKVVVVAFDPQDEAQFKKDTFRRRFGLTPAEAAVALEMLGGGGREAVADRLGVSLATVRTHLTRIFDKTGAHRQAELVRLLLETTRVGFHR